jgi:YVTN family beta-propeller protein
MSVINTATNSATGTVDTRGNPADNPVEIAMTPDGHAAYVTNRGSGTVSVIDTATDTVTATIRVHYGPNRVAVAPDGRYAYVTNGGSGTVSVIDTGI